MQNNKNCEVIDFAEFEHEMNRAFMNPAERTLDEMIQVISKMSSQMLQLLDIVENNQQRLSALIKMFCEMFPEAEIIDGMSEDKIDRMIMYRDYLNLNDNWEPRG